MTRRRRGQGEGSIYRRADGLWAGAVNLGWEAGKRRRKVVYGRTMAEARVRLRSVQAQVQSGLPIPDDQLTVGDLLGRWIDSVLPGTVATNTMVNYATIARVHILPTLGRTRLAKLTPTAVQALLQAKTQEGYSPTTVRRIRGVLVQVLKQAERWGLVARNVAALTNGPRIPKREGRTLTIDQAKALLAAARGDRLEPLYVVMLSLGLRRGEALALDWNDVDLDARTLRVRRSVRREGGKLVLGELKTAGSRRVLNLPIPVVEALRAHRVRQAAERLEAGPRWQDLGLVFTTTIGTAIDPANLRHYFEALALRAGLGHRHPHELRHSAASIMLAQGVPLEVVSEVLGHSSIRVTKDTYGHIMAPAKEAAAEAMGVALWGS